MSKKDQVIEYVKSGNYKSALRICKCWNLPITSEESSTLQRAYECILRPDFYRQIGYDPDQVISEAISILHKLYN